jgi:hypothetical protein
MRGETGTRKGHKKRKGNCKGKKKRPKERAEKVSRKDGKEEEGGGE